MRRPRARVPLLLLMLAATPAGAQRPVTSAGPDRVAVTLYRDPGRDLGEAMNAEWLQGYALVSETRRVTLPAGESELRFEGVAGGIVPQSAIVTGLPEGVVERNRDALLLSPESLLDRSLGRRVTLRRTLEATGAVTEQEAVVRTGADGAVVLQTAAGFEALRCTGLSETPVYQGVPPGLSARPTLSVRTRTAQPVTATVTLSYLASGFDWQANYVATLSADGTHMDMFAWLVLASGDETSFANAETQAVAGRLNRAPVTLDEPDRNPIALRCWPQGTTSDIPFDELVLRGSTDDLAQDRSLVLVNGRRLVPGDTLNELPQLRTTFGQMATTEGLGDLKLFRIPEPVTVAARSIKQVAFLERTQVPVRFVYRQHVVARGQSFRPAERILLTRNRDADRLGIALPGGRLQLFTSGGRPILAGEGTVRDYAVNEDVEIPLGQAPGVRSAIAPAAGSRAGNELVLTVTNDGSAPVHYEAIFEARAEDIRPQAVRLARRDGKPLWVITVPANGTATLRYRLNPGRES